MSIIAQRLLMNKIVFSNLVLFFTAKKVIANRVSGKGITVLYELMKEEGNVSDKKSFISPVKKKKNKRIKE
jgi:hypothetical protein